MATHTPTTSRRTPEAATAAPGRRSLFTGSIALALAGVGAASATPATPHPDEALLRLGERLVMANLADKAAWKLAEGEYDDEGPLTLAAEAQQVSTREIVDEIELQTATTQAGLIVKLRAFMWCQGAPADYQRDGCIDTRIMATMHDDLAAMDVTMRGLR